MVSFDQRGDHFFCADQAAFDKCQTQGKNLRSSRLWSDKTDKQKGGTAIKIGKISKFRQSQNSDMSYDSEQHENQKTIKLGTNHIVRESINLNDSMQSSLNNSYVQSPHQKHSEFPCRSQKHNDFLTIVNLNSSQLNLTQI